MSVRTLQAAAPRTAQDPRIWAILDAVDRVRLDHQARRLAWDDVLARAAREHAADLRAARRFSHTGSDGSDVAVRVFRRDPRWERLGENLALGPLEPQDAVRAWVRSPSHRATLLHPGFTHTGLAVVDCPARGPLWVQVFGRPALASAPVTLPATSWAPVLRRYAARLQDSLVSAFRPSRRPWR